ncbi:hypothetical protein L210DRAFT_3507851 [Boletus edulis BED1]|uniref:Uncharacterized protein n=1 Tax=Boletus edulis BED1 TaxID=1328754 RepID=A0AAD4BII1_BOLED|nr:hypothetical protein L210DRAFT_3507851 [Boletus edulis BED1]
MSISNNLTSVTAYLQGGGVIDGFLQLSVSNNLLKKPDIIHKVFLDRKTSKVVFIASQALSEEPDELIVIYDKELQAGPRGLIDCPYQVLKRVRRNKEFVDLTMQHKDNIQVITVIEDLQGDQASIDKKMEKTNRWSGIISVIIAEMQTATSWSKGCPQSSQKHRTLRLVFYKVQNMMEDDVLDVTEVIDRMQKHVPKETEE